MKDVQYLPNEGWIIPRLFLFLSVSDTSSSVQTTYTINIRAFEGRMCFLTFLHVQYRTRPASNTTKMTPTTTATIMPATSARLPETEKVG